MLGRFDGDPVVLPAVSAEVTTEPARTALERWREAASIRSEPPIDLEPNRGRAVLGDADVSADAWLLAAVLAHAEQPVGLVSDDRRLRTVARGLGATVTGTIGVVVRALETGVSAADGTQLIRRLDEHGLHMTAELRATAIDLVEQAATE